MSKSIHNDLDELVKNDVISDDVAQRIVEYYQLKKSPSHNRLFIVFGILGAMLVGLGIVLIIAHNWDSLSKFSRTVIAFMPLIIGQAACLYVLLKKNNNTGWREASSTFLVFAIGASISLVSQIYHIEGDLAAFVMTWALLSLPIVYIMKSSFASLLYIVAITYYAAEDGYWTYGRVSSYAYWWLMALIIPHYYFLYKKNVQSNFTIFHNWLVPISLVCSLGTLSYHYDHLMLLAYISLFGLLYLIGDRFFTKNQKLRSNGHLVIGSLGTFCLMISLSFDWYWKDVFKKVSVINEMVVSPEFIGYVLITALALGFLLYKIKKEGMKSIGGTELTFVVVIFLYFISFYSIRIPQVLTNLIVLGAAIYVIRKGALADHLGILNYGLMIITALLIARFFDTDLSFVLRGLMFMLVGAGFFAANYLMVKKRKSQNNEA